MYDLKRLIWRHEFEFFYQTSDVLLRTVEKKTEEQALSPQEMHLGASLTGICGQGQPPPVGITGRELGGEGRPQIALTSSIPYCFLPSGAISRIRSGARHAGDT